MSSERWPHYLDTQIPSDAVQRFSYLHVSPRSQSLSPSAWHTPELTLHCPANMHTSDWAQWSSVAAAQPLSTTSHQPSCLQWSDTLQSALDVATQRPSIAVHWPR